MRIRMTSQAKPAQSAKISTTIPPQSQSCQHLAQILNTSLEDLHTKSWKSIDFTREERIRVLGLLSVISGWHPSISFGQPVQVSNNSQKWTNAVVVDDGCGKHKLSVIYEDDENLRIVQVPQSQVRPY